MKNNQKQLEIICLIKSLTKKKISIFADLSNISLPLAIISSKPMLNSSFQKSKNSLS